MSIHPGRRRETVARLGVCLGRGAVALEEWVRPANLWGAEAEPGGRGIPPYWWSKRIFRLPCRMAV